MSAELLFVFILLMGIVLIHLGKKLAKKAIKLLIVIGVAFILFGGFGVFTALL